MSREFSNYILVTDLDGTLVSHQMEILPKDIAAIERFTAGGGRFAVSTGRAMVSAMQFVQQLPHNVPCVFFNGGVVMDVGTGEFHHQCFLPEGAREYVREMLKEFPNMRAAVLRDNNYYNITERNDGEEPFVLEGVAILTADLEELTYPWYKILFNVMDHPMDEVASYAQSRSYEGVRFIPSTACYYEMIPEGITKADGVQKMLELSGNTDRVLVAIGDYYNDLEMIQEADFGVAVGNAPQEVKDQADLVVCSVQDGALSQLIDYLGTHNVQKSHTAAQ